ncbi:hypothetical protein IWZ00DRAFT_518093 [Phyllosticta capitalensis]|uniref:uncharacterized protein n=1 Tax=Phyllosticta capitalensis TaxID=121624 RepID=UPI003132185E
MPQTLELGQLCLSIPKAKLQLTSETTITASPSSPNLASTLAERSAWVRRGQGLHLALDVRLDGAPLDCEQSHQLANSICDAALWKHLQLRATLPVPQHDAREESNSIRINLAHLDVDARQEKSRHRISSGAFIADIQPPEGVHQISLEQVKLNVDISPLRASPRRKIRRTKNPQPRRDNSTGPTGHGHSQVNNLDGTSDADFEDYTCMDSPDEAELEFELVSDNDSMILDLPEECMIVDPVESGGCDRNVQTSKAVRVDSGISMECQGEGVAQNIGALSTGTIASLVNIALYYSICDKAPKQKGGVKVKSDNMKMKLASIAPALWSPGFLKTISERAPFVSTISHTLSGPLLMNARSSVLREKLARLHNTSYTGLSTGDATPSCRSSLYDSMSVNIWNLVQRELYDPGAARRLWPLESNHSKDAAALTQDDDDLLQELWADSHEIVAGNEDEDYGFEDMDEYMDLEDDAFLGVETDSEDDEFDLLHEPDFSDDVIVDSAYARFMPLQATFATVEHETNFSGMLQDWPSDFDDMFEHEELGDSF